MRYVLPILFLLASPAIAANKYCDADLASGANDGSSWANAYRTFQAAADAAGAGDTVYCKGTDSLSAAVDFDTNSGTYNGGYIKFVGVNAACTNAPPQVSDYGDYFILDGQDGNIDGIYINGRSYVWLENIKIHSCNGTAAINLASAVADDWVLNNVWCHDNDGIGVYSHDFLRYPTFSRCRFTNNTSAGAYQVQAAHWEFCAFLNNAGVGIRIDHLTTLYGCIFHGNGDDGVLLYGGPTALVNCTIDANSGHGVNVLAGANPLFVGCRITNHSQAAKLGISVGASIRVKLLGCYFGNNTTDITGSRYDSIPVNGTSYLTLAGSDTNHGYTTPASDDFNLRTDATYRRQAVGLDGTNDAYISAGLPPNDLTASQIGLAADDLQKDVVVGDVTGQFHYPTEPQVEDGVGFGADGTEYTGTLVGGEGGGETSHVWVK
jgi:hypothetical protein